MVVHQCLHGLAPTYISDDLQLVTELPGRQRLHSSLTSALVVPPTWLQTVRNRAFPVAAAKTWNSLPPEVTLSRSMSSSAFKSKLKTYFPVFSWSGDWNASCTIPLKTYVMLCYVMLCQVVQALGNSYHRSCFRCSCCNECIGEMPFTVDTDKHLLCLPDYYRLIYTNHYRLIYILMSTGEY